MTTKYAVKLKIWRDPDGLYLLKGGGPEVWKRFRIKKKWREAQGIIHGAFLIDIVLAAWLAATHQIGRGTLVVGLALSYLLVALSLLYSTISGEYQGAQWFIWVLILINLAFTVAMIWLITKQAGPGRG